MREFKMPEQRKVHHFIEQVGQESSTYPAFPDNATCELRVALIQEELWEFRDAIKSGDMVGVADALGDLLYVVLGAGVSFGIDLEPVFSEIHRSNLTKLIDGYKDENGKWRKGKSYEPPNLMPILQGQSDEHIDSIWKT